VRFVYAPNIAEVAGTKEYARKIGCVPSDDEIGAGDDNDIMTAWSLSDLDIAKIARTFICQRDSRLSEIDAAVDELDRRKREFGGLGVAPARPGQSHVLRAGLQVS
jgi:hypothetical protein